MDVIATDYGGNTDFCNGPLAHPVPFRLIPVQAGEHPYHAVLVLADPDVHEAARRMQLVAAARRNNQVQDPFVVQVYRDRFSVPRSGALHRQRLEDLWEKGEQILAQLDHR